jgi:osmotically-inducible protein OsmY
MRLPDNGSGEWFLGGGRRMRNLRPIIGVVLILALPLVLGGCPSAIVAGMDAAGSSIDDFKIKTNIQNAWLNTNPLMQRDLTVTVYEGRTLLTGAAPTTEFKAQAKEVASRVPGVKAIYDEIEVAPSESAWDSAKDSWISTRVRSELAFTPDIRSANYTVETANKSVYLIGSARSQAELDIATKAARTTPDVKRVVSYVEIRPGVPVAAQATPSSSPSAVGTSTPAAAPTTPVEVQKL